MGRHVSNPALTKLPAPLFDDLAPGGSLCHILATAYRVKTEQSWSVCSRTLLQSGYPKIGHLNKRDTFHCALQPLVSFSCRRRFDFHSPARIDRGMELFIAIHRDLAQNKVWEPPKLFFDSSVSKQTVQQLTEIVKRHQVCVCVCACACACVCDYISIFTGVSS